MGDQCLAWNPSSFHVALSHTPAQSRRKRPKTIYWVWFFFFFLGGWSCCLLGNFNLSWSWKVRSGGAEGSVAFCGCTSPQTFLLSAPVSCFSNAFLFQIWEGLTQRFHRVIALDFVGFGFSDKPVSSLGRGFFAVAFGPEAVLLCQHPRKIGVCSPVSSPICIWKRNKTL